MARAKRAPCVALVCLALAWACGEPGTVTLDGNAGPLSAMTYNLANLSGTERDAISARIATISPDFVGLQECIDCDELPASVASRYEISMAPEAGVSILYDASMWRVDEKGSIELGNNDDGWGPRVSTWARFDHYDGPDSVTVYSTHFCGPLRTTDDACDVQRQLEYADHLLELVDSRTTQGALILGDFNVFDGFEDGDVIARFVNAGFVDVLRAHSPDVDGTTFLGNSWAPAGRLDYIFATAPVEVLDSFIDRDGVVGGTASDHYPVVATVEFGEL